MVADEQLGKEYWPLYSLMRRAAAAPLLAFPDKEDESSLEVSQLISLNTPVVSAGNTVQHCVYPRFTGFRLGDTPDCK